ncbi:hypothetical protein GBSOP10_10622 [Armatimonadetes bacterium GBS]|jgi:hypothetical protein|nr:MAG: hypothetical protein KatS3mg021_0553 [Fimbriimonadales bacterium]CUU09861.1 hypothetical protein GBSOP10_10622 [Armatimonadetes bacterium GBS]CUU36868.1 hypothetical protein GXSOP10_12940 [Armatimonadetes bacterium GXS]
MIASELLESEWRQYRIRQNREALRERLWHCLGSEASAATIRAPSACSQISKGSSQTSPSLNVYPETLAQLRELVDSFWQAVPSDRWVVWVGADYPEFVLSDNLLKRRLWQLVEAFEGLAIRKPGAHSALYLDASENDFYASVRGKRWASVLYDTYTQIAKRDYGWELFRERLPSMHAFVGLLFREQDAFQIAQLFEKVRLCLSGVSLERNEMEQGLRLTDARTDQFVRITRLSESGVWCMEAAGTDFTRRLERIYGYLRGKMMTRVEGYPKLHGYV